MNPRAPLIDADGEVRELSAADMRKFKPATEVLPLDLMLPAPGQGALAVQCRDDASVRALLAPLDDASARELRARLLKRLNR